MANKGVIAVGHPDTAAAAAAILEDGGNAYDAALAALFAACVAEPVLASLGGGGFLLARTAEGRVAAYDFFTQTPRQRRDEADVDFFPIVTDFGTAQQEFHIGMGSIATPGVVRGLFLVHRDLGRLPMTRIVEPAAALGRTGVEVNGFQAHLFDVVEPIYMSNATCRAVYGSREHEGVPVRRGEVLANAEFADLIEALAREGEGLFYRGEVARRIVADCQAGGGNLGEADFAGYRAIVRRPLERTFRTARLFTNPPPSTGGILIAFALELLRETGLGELRFGSRAHLERLAEVMALTNKARIDSCLHEADEDRAAAVLLDPDLIDAYRRQIAGRPATARGTTQISIIDGDGNAASMTVSNGEGAAYIVPGTGVMLNNMLGEADINPYGFHRWPTDVRMASMMSPTILLRGDGARVALGSGGSNRIRTAILQVLLNVLAFGMPLDEAVDSPRIHYEEGRLSVEAGFDEDEVRGLAAAYPDMEMWEGRNFFFGGAHSVLFDPGPGRFAGAGDARRGGVTVTV